VKSSIMTRPTIKDVARVADVSASTVSYILNKSPAANRIREETKERVWLAVQQLGYQFNPIGRALQRGYTNQVTLLVVTWNLATSHASTAMAISRAAAEHDLVLSVHVADDDASAEAFVRRSTFHSSGGVLVLWDSPAFEQSLLGQLAAEGVPVIDLLPNDTPGISVVTADREEAGFRATAHLAQLGHKDIGFIGDVATRPKTTLRKLSGYQRALRAANILPRPAWVQNVTEFGFEGGRHGIQQLLARSPEVTALFCINDAIALGAQDAAHDLGRCCPSQLSIVGFGDSPEGRHWRPKLTTVALSARRVADKTVELLLQRSGRGEAFTPAKVLIPEELIVRESTAIPATTSLPRLAAQLPSRLPAGGDSGGGGL
jgi:LacI family transcriptional regulator